MRIGVISDTHGNVQVIRRMLAAAEPVDGWLHAGDYSQDARFLAEWSGVPVTVVAGNCDGRVATLPDEYVEAGARKIWLTHGHRYGVKQDLSDLLWWARQFEVQAVVFGHTHIPYCRRHGEVLALNPDGIFLSNGPGDPKDVPADIATVKELLGKKPVFGICLGHQLLALACGGDTYKMKFGHRGANHPVKDLATGRVYITSQNHGYAIQEESLAGKELTVTHRAVNDGTVEGMRHNRLPAFSVQYHPEAAPGPDDNTYLFDQFMQLMAARGN